MIDYEITGNGAKIVYELIDGDVVAVNRVYTRAVLKSIYKDLLVALKGFISVIFIIMMYARGM